MARLGEMDVRDFGREVKEKHPEVPVIILAYNPAEAARLTALQGAEILFFTPSGDFVADPGIYTCMSYMLLFHELGIDYTWSTYADN